MAKDNSSAVVITYKGRHDHDIPVPKKHHGPPSIAPASVNNTSSQVTKSEPLQQQDQVSAAAQWPAEKDGEELTGKPLEAGGEKTMESARTLLSIGFEIKPC